MTGFRQIPLALRHPPALGRSDFLVSDSNRDAFRAVATAEPDTRLALSGPAGSGKSHLAAIWTAAQNAERIEATDLTEQRLQAMLDGGAVAIENADRLCELPGPARRQIEALLFHLLNLTKSEARGLLISGRTPPARWQTETPDLASRLSALPHIAVQEPDDTLLSSMLTKLFSDRQLSVSGEVLVYLVRRMERSCAAAEVLVDRLDALALAERRAVTRPLASRLFAEETGAARDEEN